MLLSKLQNPQTPVAALTPPATTRFGKRPMGRSSGRMPPLHLAKLDSRRVARTPRVQSGRPRWRNGSNRSRRSPLELPRLLCRKQEFMGSRLAWMPGRRKAIKRATYQPRGARPLYSTSHSGRHSRMSNLRGSQCKLQISKAATLRMRQRRTLRGHKASVFANKDWALIRQQCNIRKRLQQGG